jgi:hypothetical protein
MDAVSFCGCNDPLSCDFCSLFPQSQGNRKRGQIDDAMDPQIIVGRSLIGGAVIECEQVNMGMFNDAEWVLSWK